MRNNQRVRYVLFVDKRTNEQFTFPTIVQMYASLGVKRIGLVKNSLFNALSKDNGLYENEKIKVEYKDIINFTIG